MRAGVSVMREEETGLPDIPADVAGCLERLDAAGTGEVTVRRRVGTCGGIVEYWREGGAVRQRAVAAPDGAAVLAALQESVASEFGGLSGKLLAEACGAVPDLDGIETALRDGVHGAGAAGLRALLEEVDRRLPAPACGNCGARMETLGYHGKTFTCRLGKVTVRRKRVHCRTCRSGFFPLDRHLGLEGANVTPGAASVIAALVKDDSYDGSSRKLLNAAGIDLGSSSIHRWVNRMSASLQRFEREEVVPGEPPSERCVLSIDGTGVPMRGEETEGVRGRRDDGSSGTREAKVIAIYTADSRNPKTGEPRKDPGSDVRSGLIDSAAAGTGGSLGTGFGKRLEREAERNGLFAARELVVISDGAGWIRNVCEDLFSGRAVTYVLDFFHLSEYLSDALKAILPDEAERRRRFETDKARLKDNQALAVIADLRPHAGRHGDVAKCVRYMEANVSRMRYGTYLERGMHIGSGVVESACRSLVCMRLKRPGNHWSVAGANAILSLKTCVENNRWADFLHWNASQPKTA